MSQTLEDRFMERCHKRFTGKQMANPVVLLRIRMKINHLYARYPHQRDALTQVMRERAELCDIDSTIL